MLSFTEYSRRRPGSFRGRLAGYRRSVIDDEARFVRHRELRTEVEGITGQLDAMARRRDQPDDVSVDELAAQLRLLAARQLVEDADPDRLAGRFDDPYGLVGDPRADGYRWPAARAPGRGRPRARTVADLLALDAYGRESDAFNQVRYHGRDEKRVLRAIHMIWLGGPFTESRGHAQLRSFRSEGHLPLGFLWTDLDRAALAATTPELQEMQTFCTANKITVLCVDEVFDERQPMRHQALFNLLRLGREWAAAAHVLRYELLHRFGGVYADTDVTCDGPIDWEAVQPIPKARGRFAMGATDDGLPTPALLVATERNPIIGEILDVVDEAFDRSTDRVLRSTPSVRPLRAEYPYTRRHGDEIAARTGRTAAYVGLLRQVLGATPVGGKHRIEHLFPAAWARLDDTTLSAEEVYGLHADEILRQQAGSERDEWAAPWLERSFLRDVAAATARARIGAGVPSVGVRHLPTTTPDEAAAAVTWLLFRLRCDPGVLDLIPLQGDPSTSRADAVLDAVVQLRPNALDRTGIALVSYAAPGAAAEGHAATHASSMRGLLAELGFEAAHSSRTDVVRPGERTLGELRVTRRTT